VRDFFHYCDNYIDAVDRAAEHFATSAGPGKDVLITASEALRKRGVDVQFSDTGPLRHFDGTARRLELSARAAAPTQRFQLLYQVALQTQNDLLEATLDLARFTTPEARDIAKIGLANYFAGAALMPYRIFLAAAQKTRHDLERLADLFGASIEQVAHRLSTLQRPGAKGIPFFFVRVDQAGTITKRHSATRLQFARFGGACPCGTSIAPLKPRAISCGNWPRPRTACAICACRAMCQSRAGRFNAPVRRYAISLGCEITHAASLVYADGLDLTNPQRLRTDRHFLPHLRTPRLPPTFGAAIGTPPAGGPRYAGGVALRYRRLKKGADWPPFPGLASGHFRCDQM
jgi:predicted transcriptional regulator